MNATEPAIRAAREQLRILVIDDDAVSRFTLEQHLAQRVNVRFTLGFCPACFEHRVLPDLEDRE